MIRLQCIGLYLDNTDIYYEIAEKEIHKGYSRKHSKSSFVRQAVDTTHLTDSVTMLTKEGFELRHEVFLHDAPAPEPEPEEVVEE